MAPKLYMILPSPPVRAVLLCAKALGIELEQIEVDLLNREHLKPEFTKLNPQHTVPVLVDGDFVLADSHAIMGYLVEKYKEGSPLYPRDIKKRATINHRLHFDSSILFVRGLIVSRSIVFYGTKTISQESIDSIKESYGFLESFLENNKWVAGDELSIADFSIVTTITAWNHLVPIDESKHPRIMSWIKQMENLPYYHESQDKGIEMYKSLIDSKLGK